MLVQTVAVTTTKNDSDKKAEKRRAKEEKRIRQQEADDKKKADKEQRKAEKRERRQIRRDAIIDVAGRDPSKVVTWSLFVGLIAVIVVNGVLSYAGLYGYAHDVQKLSTLLAVLVPVGIEGLTISAIASIYALRVADWYVQTYCWLVFAVAVTASVGGNVAHAAYDSPRARFLDFVGIAWAAVPPALLTLTTHLAVVVMRRLEIAASFKALLAKRQGATNGEPAPVADESPTTADVVSVPEIVAPAVIVADAVAPTSPATTDKPRQIKKRTKVMTAISDSPRDYTEERDYTERRARQGATAADICRELKVPMDDKNLERNVQRWSKAVRERVLFSSPELQDV